MAVIKEDSGDAGAAAGTSYAISLGDVFQGRLDPANDDDWIKVELDAGTIYDFTLRFTVGDVDSSELALFDASGNFVVSGVVIPYGSGASLIVSPDTTGTYYIQAGSRDNAFTGDYELSLVENTIPVGTYDELAEYLIDEQGGTVPAFDVGPGDTLTANIISLTKQDQQLARWALEAWGNVIGVQFRFVDNDDADITFSNRPDTNATGGILTRNDNLIISSYVNTPIDFLTEYGTTIGSRNFTGYLHELGHAFGLGHTGPYSTITLPFVYFGSDHNVFLIDSQQATVMTYFSQDQNTYINASGAEPVTPMIVDIIAMQKLYGVPTGINAGDTVYGYQSNLDGYLGEFFRLWTGEANPFYGLKTPSNTYFPLAKPALTDLDGDGDPDLVIGNNTGLLYYFENTGTSAKPVFTESAGADNPLDGISVGSYSAPAFSDLDGDGDHDLIVANRNGNVSYFENTGTPTAPAYTQRTDVANPFHSITMGTLSTLTLADLDGDGDLDLAAGTNDGDVAYHENIGTVTNPEYVLRTGASSPLNGIDAGSYNSPVFADVDNDDDFDLVVGNWDGGILYFENTGTTTEPGFTQRTDPDSPLHGAFAGYWIGLEFADLNDDGHPDLIVGNDDGIIHYFESAGTYENPAFSQQSLSYPTTFTIYDNGGTDTLDLRTDTQDQRVYLRPEGISDVYGLIGNVIIARDTWIENFIAGSGDDFIAGNAVANDLNGREGNDRIWGSGGDDILEGGAGADRLDGDAGLDWAAYRDSDAAVTVNLAEDIVQGGHAEGDVLTEIENIIGSAHDDVLVGNDDANQLEGGAGADRLEGGVGSDWASYAGSNEGVTVDLAQGTSTGGHAEGDVIIDMENVSGSDYSDVLRGDGNANSLSGEGGDDRLWGAGGDDILAGGDGDDWLFGSAGADRLEGGAGHDVLTYERSGAGVTVNLADGTVMGGDAEGDVFTGIEHIVGSGYGDMLTGDDGSNELYGIGGDDEIRGNAGDDSLSGGAGADRLDGGAGADWAVYLASEAGVTVNLADNTATGGHAQGDVITGIEHISGSDYRDILTGDTGANELYGAGGDDVLRGGAGNDELEGGAGADRLEGGAGLDWVVYLTSDTGVTVDLLNNRGDGGHAAGDVLSGIEHIVGSAHPDVLTGDDGANELVGNAGDDTLRGNGGDDVLAGNAGADRLHGGAGADTLSYRLSGAGVRVNLAEGTAAGAHAEGDTFTGIENVTGSDYRDVLSGDAGANRLDGAEGDDALHGGGGADRLIGNGGDDELHGGEGDDDLRGNAGNDRLYGELGADVLWGDEGADELHGGADGDQLFGGVGADSLHGDEGDDELQGDEGNDRLYGQAGADRLDGGGGIDWASYVNSGAGVRVNLATGTLSGGDARGDVLIAIENLAGSGHDDVLRGDGGANELHGLAGADELYGEAGNDVLEGGAGADRLQGGPGVDTASYQGSDAGVFVDLKYGNTGGGHAADDSLISIENVTGSDYDDDLRGDDGVNRLRGGAGRDTLHGGAGADWLDGGYGVDDLVSYWLSGERVTVNLEDGTGAGGDAEGDVIVNVEGIQGSDYQDVLVGDKGNNFLGGLDGDDELRGNEGDDYLRGGAGDDELYGGSGDDWLEGSAGADRLEGGAGDDGLHGGAGADWLDGGYGVDDYVSYRLSGEAVTVNLEDGTGAGGDAEGDVIVNVEGIQGSDYQDVLVGDKGNNFLGGLDGDDELRGNEGDDYLRGGAGDDELYGGSGDDWLEGSAGADRLEGGAGDDELYGDPKDGEKSADVFVFAAGHGGDSISDFTDNQDKIDLSAFNLSGFDDLDLSAEFVGTTIDLSAHGGDTILLVGFYIADLDATDFLF